MIPGEFLAAASAFAKVQERLRPGPAVAET
jgi:hypothetical protein